MKVVIKRERPLRTLLWSVLFIVIAGVIAVFFVHAERERFDSQIAQLRKERMLLARGHRRLLDDNEELRRRLAVAERSKEVESNAYARVNDHLRRLQDELQLAKEEVTFYQGITSNSGRRGVRIQRLQIDPAPVSGEYRFRVVLTRSSEDNNVLAGTIALHVDGALAGRPTSLAFERIESQQRNSLEFNFRHFQRIEGLLALPADFEPNSVEIELTTIEQDKQSILRESYAWPGK